MLKDIDPYYKMQEIRKQASVQQRRLLNIISGTRDYALDYQLYKKNLNQRNSSKFRQSQSVMHSIEDSMRSSNRGRERLNQTDIAKNSKGDSSAEKDNFALLTDL